MNPIKIKRGEVLRTMNTLTEFDSGASPYVGLQIDGIPRFHRSGRHGYVETVGYDGAQPPLTAFSLPHLRTALASLTAEELELAVDTNGVVVLTSPGIYKTVLRIHCTRIDNPANWKVLHIAGKPVEELPTEEFKGIKTNVFSPLAVEPVLRRNQLMLATNAAIVVRRDVKVTAFPWPRSLFLKALTSSKPTRLAMTDKGYWALQASDLWYFVSGHRSGEALAEEYDKPATTLSEIPAIPLLTALNGAVKMSGKANRIQVDPNIGFIAQDDFGEKNTYGIGSSGFSTFAIYPKTAEVIADAISQDAAETATLGTIDADTMRISRGLWDVTFKIYIK